jgi:hypothetical protein
MNSQAVRALVAGIVAIVLVVVLVVILTNDDDSDGESAPDGSEAAPMLVEYDPDGQPIPLDDQVSAGEASLTRTPTGLTTTAHVTGLIPDGVYTFWMVAYYDGGLEFPNDRTTNLGQGVVADENGEASSEMRMDVGEAGIRGFYVEAIGEEAVFPDLLNADSLVRVEVVYHGQADVAGDELDAWMADFWTGDPTVCANPLGTTGTGDVAEHPYCAGYWAATFEAVEAPA